MFQSPALDSTPNESFIKSELVANVTAHPESNITRKLFEAVMKTYSIMARKAKGKDASRVFLVLTLALIWIAICYMIPPEALLSSSWR